MDRKAFRRANARGIYVPGVIHMTMEIMTEGMMMHRSFKLQKKNTGAVFIDDG